MASDSLTWKCRTKLEKFKPGDGEPYETIVDEGNVLVYGGASALWQRLKGTAVTAFDNSNAYIGVGTGTTAADATQTALVSTNPNTAYEAMDATYPVHTDGTSSTNASITYKSTFESADAQFEWNEWGIFNGNTEGVSRMLNRKRITYGTKGAEDWSLTITLTIQ